MTTAELARLTMLAPRTSRRYAQTGILNPRRRLLGGYDFSGDDIDSALVARDLKQRRLELVGPGLAPVPATAPRGRQNIHDGPEEAKDGPRRRSRADSGPVSSMRLRDGIAVAAGQ